MAHGKGKNMNKLTFHISGLVCAALLSVTPAWAKDTLVMGVHPYKPATELHKIFKPIADYVSQKVGKPVDLQIAQSYEDAAEKAGNGRFDFSYMGPTTYAKESGPQKLKPLVQIINNGKPTFYGVIIVKQGSGLTSLKQLKGRSFVFGEKNSTLTHVVPLYLLLNEGIHLRDLKKHAFVGSHDNVALNVKIGTFDGGGLMPDIAEKYKDQGIEIITKSPELPEHVFVATKSMDAATFSKIQDALLTMDLSILKGIKPSLTGTQKVRDKDFDILRTIMDTVEQEMGRTE